MSSSLRSNDEIAAVGGRSASYSRWGTYTSLRLSLLTIAEARRLRKMTGRLRSQDGRSPRDRTSRLSPDSTHSVTMSTVFKPYPEAPR